MKDREAAEREAARRQSELDLLRRLVDESEAIRRRVEAAEREAARRGAAERKAAAEPVRRGRPKKKACS